MRAATPGPQAAGATCSAPAADTAGHPCDAGVRFPTPWTLVLDADLQPLRIEDRDGRRVLRIHEHWSRPEDRRFWRSLIDTVNARWP